jgi:hypothetical protein
MKKLTAIFFLFIYLNPALGLGVDIHFCGGAVTDVEIVGLGHAHCTCPPGSMPPGCCKNVVCFCKTDQHRMSGVPALTGLKLLVQAPVLLPDLTCARPLPDFDATTIPLYNGFRQRPLPDLYVLHRVLRI